EYDKETIKKIMPQISYNSFIWIRRWLNWGPRGAHAHNLFLEMTISMGLLSLFAILWFLNANIKNFIECKKTLSKGGFLNNKSSPKDIYHLALLIGGTGGIIGVLACSMFDYPFGFLSLGINIALILGLQTKFQDLLIPDSYPVLISKYPKKTKILSNTFISIFFIVAAMVLVIFISSPILALKLYDKGSYYERIKEYSKVLPFFKMASFFDPLNPDYYEKQGDLSLKTENYENAQYYYSKTLSHSHHDSGVLNKLGLLNWLLRNRDKSIQFFKEALKNDPIGISGNEHFSILALALYDQPEKNLLCFQLIKSTVMFYPYKVNDIFWVLPSSKLQNRIKVIAINFRQEQTAQKPLFSLDDFLQKKISEAQKHIPQFYEEQLVIQKVTTPKNDLPYDNAIYLSDILEDIYSQYDSIKVKDPVSAREILVILASAYKLCNYPKKSDELLKIAGVEKLPMYDKKGDVIEKIELNP
ncbi:hypothetical protein KKB18_01440, partial [bacterium]|nr:hypothetical protein [bacterium]